ncbi:hypothetical protein BSR03_17260 [Serratia proteamaculans]|uniref:hypothetical protein n=1 Tax=Serratia proteamaculans TaxID=28151 RepID=UPI00101F6FBE|nr:hypothetical protein [Serratia proteamaculans]RYM60192.1 hypothetical protein BSR03_17260 [Serratia proteamaculans]
MKLIDYIEKYFNGNKSAFARHEGVDQAYVYKWLKMECIIVDGKLYSPRREMNPVDLKTK